jgi:hypothetical protein
MAFIPSAAPLPPPTPQDQISPTTHSTTPPQRRVEAQPHLITWSMVAEEAASGKNFVSPYPDREGRPVVTMRPRWGGALGFGCARGGLGGCLRVVDVIKADLVVLSWS